MMRGNQEFYKEIMRKLTLFSLLVALSFVLARVPAHAQDELAPAHSRLNGAAARD